MRRPLALTFIALCLASAPGRGIDTIALHIDGLAHPGLRAKDIELRVALAKDSSSPGASAPLTLTIADIDLGPELGRFRQVTVDCGRAEIAPPQFGCSGALVRFKSDRVGDQRIQADLQWDNGRRILQLSTRGLAIASGQVQVTGRWSPGGWTMQVEASAVALSKLRTLLGVSLRLPSTWTLEGTLASLHARLSGAETLQYASIEASTTGINLANPDGTTASADLASHVTAEARKAAGGWNFTGSLEATHGELLAGRGYWNFSKQALQADSAGSWRDGVLDLARTSLTLGTMLKATLDGRITPGAQILVPTLRVALTDFDFSALPPQTRDGLLSGSIVSQLQGSGHFSGSIEIDQGLPAAANLNLREVKLEDRNAKLAMDGLNGHVFWQSLERSKQRAAGAATDSSSDLRWNKGLLYGVGIGGAAIRFSTASNDVKLLEPVRIPILDGGLAIKTLQLRHLGEDAVSIRFDSTLDPISVPLLCKAFGWPEFAGTLSGNIPDLNLEAGVLTLGGALQAAIFEGTASVRDLKLSDPFGARPRLQANVRFDRLDLAEVTGAFSFGKITGLISGYANDLELVGWEPVAFDASLFTTPGDKSRHRISQRAVENISSIGGGTGATAALQRGVLRFFNEFNYSELGLSCTLRNDICLMRGIEPHDYGYYLVKGRGLPRIDVIGDAGRIDWPSLVASLKQLSTSQATVGKPP